MKNKGSKPLGRPPEIDRLEIVRNNGYTERQWAWLEREATLKGIPTMEYIRKYPIQWWIDSVEASRTGPTATPIDDKEFERLVENRSATNHKKRRK